MKIRRIFLFGTLACMFCVFPGCKDSDDVGENYTTFTGETVSDFLQDNEEYSAFVDALKTANALPLLESYGAYTCFVPNNAAMGTYVKEQGYGSFEHFLDSVEAVKEMVFYHLTVRPTMRETMKRPVLRPDLSTRKTCWGVICTRPLRPMGLRG